MGLPLSAELKGIFKGIFNEQVTLFCNMSLPCYMLCVVSAPKACWLAASSWHWRNDVTESDSKVTVISSFENSLPHDLTPSSFAIWMGVSSASMFSSPSYSERTLNRILNRKMSALLGAKKLGRTSNISAICSPNCICDEAGRANDSDVKTQGQS